MREKSAFGSVGAAIVIDDKLIARRVTGRFVFGWFVGYLIGGVGFLVLVVGGFVWMFETADEEFAGKGNVDIYIAVHGVFREEVNTEFLAGFGEAPLAVKGDDVGVHTASMVKVDEFEKFKGHFFRRGGEGTVDGAAVVVVDFGELVVEGAVEDAATEAVSGEHAGDEGFEFDIAMV